MKPSNACREPAATWVWWPCSDNLHQVAGDRRPFGAEDVQIEEVGGVEVTIEGVVVVDHHGPSRRALPQQVGAAGGVAQLPILVANPPVEGQQIAAEVCVAVPNQ